MNEQYDEQDLIEEITEDDEIVDEEDEVVLPDDENTEKLPNVVTGFARVVSCEQKGDEIIASLMTSNPEPKTQFPTYHPATLPEMVETGSIVSIVGEIAQDMIWLPARVRGRFVPNGDETAGAEVATQFIKASSVRVADVPEDFVARLHAYIEVQLMELVGKGGSDKRNQARDARRGRRRGRRREGVFNQALEEMNFRPSDLVQYLGLTGNDIEIRVEAFFSDYFNRNNLERDARLYLDVVPQWNTDTEGTVEIISKKTGRPMKAKLPVRGRMTSMPVITHPYSFRAVIATRILGSNFQEVNEGDIEEVIEDVADIRSHVSRMSNLNR